MKKSEKINRIAISIEERLLKDVLGITKQKKKSRAINIVYKVKTKGEFIISQRQY